MKKRVLVVLLGVMFLLVLGGFVFRDSLKNWFFRPTESDVKVGIESADETLVSILAEDLRTPWSLSFLPSGDILVTERSGRVQRLGENGQIFPISGVRETSEGGLLGIALHPQFSRNNRVYVYLTTEVAGQLQNRVDQYVLIGDQMRFERTIISDIPAASNHNGGAIAFGPDEKLYITTGDAAQPDLAQSRSSLAGKILRMNADGSVPDDNPFNNFVWSYGHRNPQGIAWDGEGRLWSVEHGPSGFEGSGQDELNLIEKGANYGWSVIRGDQQAPDMQRPVAHSGSDETWAPAALAYHYGSLYFAGLRGQSLYQAVLNDDNSVSLKRHFSSQYGRLRAVSVRGNELFISTSNHDGRGTPKSGDDKVIRVNLRLLNEE